MDPQELARQIAFLAASDDPKLKAQAQDIMDALKTQERDRAIYGGGDGQAVLGAVFRGLKAFGSRLGGAVATFTDEVDAQIEAEPLLRPVGRAVREGIGQGITAGVQGVRSDVQALGDALNPQAAASRLLAEQQAQINQGPLQGLGPDLQQQAAALATSQVIPGFTPGTGVTPDIQQQAAAYAANQAGALQGINQQEALVSELQARQLEARVQNEELQRQSEMMGLLQTLEGNPNALNNAAAFSAAPAVGSAPNNLTTLLPQQQSIGSVDIPSGLKAAQTNINQRQRTASLESPFIDSSIQQQERALELARQEYIDNVARQIMNRSR